MHYAWLYKMYLFAWLIATDGQSLHDVYTPAVQTSFSKICDRNYLTLALGNTW